MRALIVLATIGYLIMWWLIVVSFIPHPILLFVVAFAGASIIIWLGGLAYTSHS